MVDANTIAASVAVGLAAEATGVTDVTSIGRQGDAGQPGGGSSGLPPGIAALLQDAKAARGTVQQGLNTGQNVTDAIGELAAFTRQVQQTRDDMGNSVEKVTKTIPQIIPPQIQGPTQGGTTSTQQQRGTQQQSGSTPTAVSQPSNTGLQLQSRSGPIGTGAKVAEETGGVLGDIGNFVGENPYATGGALAGLAAAPFTGGTSIPVGVAAGGGVAEISADVLTGQYGDASGDLADTVGSTADTVVGGITDAVSGPAATTLRGPALGANAIRSGIDKITNQSSSRDRDRDSGNSSRSSSSSKSSQSDAPDWRDYGSVTRRRDDDNNTGVDASPSTVRRARSAAEATAGGDPAKDPSDEKKTVDREYTSITRIR